MRDHKQGSHIDGITTQNAIREECYWWEKLVDKSGRKKNHRIYKKKMEDTTSKREIWTAKIRKKTRKMKIRNIKLIAINKSVIPERSSNFFFPFFFTPQSSAAELIKTEPAIITSVWWAAPGNVDVIWWPRKKNMKRLNIDLLASVIVSCFWTLQHCINMTQCRKTI